MWNLNLSRTELCVVTLQLILTLSAACAAQQVPAPRVVESRRDRWHKVEGNIFLLRKSPGLVYCCCTSATCSAKVGTASRPNSPRLEFPS